MELIDQRTGGGMIVGEIERAAPRFRANRISSRVSAVKGSRADYRVARREISVVRARNDEFSSRPRLWFPLQGGGKGSW